MTFSCHFVHVISRLPVAQYILTALFSLTCLTPSWFAGLFVCVTRCEETRCIFTIHSSHYSLHHISSTGRQHTVPGIFVEVMRRMLNLIYSTRLYSAPPCRILTIHPDRLPRICILLLSILPSFLSSSARSLASSLIY